MKKVENFLPLIPLGKLPVEPSRELIEENFYLLHKQFNVGYSKWINQWMLNVEDENGKCFREWAWYTWNIFFLPNSKMSNNLTFFRTVAYST